MKQWLIIFYLGLLVISTSIKIANAQSLSSTNNRVSVIELYTSEGCNSCPPAEEWLSQLKHDKRLWNEFIPMAFHVDYWDYIGWRDRFANQEFSNRQRHYAEEHQVSTIYTPGFLVNGKEWRGWYSGKPLILNNEQSGKLSINIDQNKISAKYTPKEFKKASFTINIAILGFNLSSQVNAGENDGRKLTHDFVVLGFKQMNMSQENEKEFIIKSTQMPDISVKSEQTAIVSWVHEGNHLTPIQAVGGILNH